MARNMITGKETQKMQEYTQEQIDRAEHMGIAIPADVKEQIFEYANLIGEEEKVLVLTVQPIDEFFHSGQQPVAVIYHAVHIADETFFASELFHVILHILFFKCIISRNIIL